MKKYTKTEFRFNEQVVEAAKQAHGITEPCRTWGDWRNYGYSVNRNAVPLFKEGIKVWRCNHLAEFFGASQVAPCRGLVQFPEALTVQ